MGARRLEFELCRLDMKSERANRLAGPYVAYVNYVLRKALF